MLCRQAINQSLLLLQKLHRASFLSGVLNVLLTNPLWVVNSRLKMSGVKKEDTRYRGLLDGLIKIAVQVMIVRLRGTRLMFTMFDIRKGWGHSGTEPRLPSCWSPTRPSSLHSTSCSKDITRPVLVAKSRESQPSYWDASQRP